MVSGSRSEIERLKRRIDVLETRVEFLMRSAGHDVPKPETEASDEVMEHLLIGDKIGAIKAYRRETGASLKDAKEFIESIKN